MLTRDVSVLELTGGVDWGNATTELPGSPVREKLSSLSSCGSPPKLDHQREHALAVQSMPIGMVESAVSSI